VDSQITFAQIFITILLINICKKFDLIRSTTASSNLQISIQRTLKEYNKESI